MFIRLAYVDNSGFREDVLIFHMSVVKVADIFQKMAHLHGKYHTMYIYNEHGRVMKLSEAVDYGRSYTLVRRPKV